jgi:DNA-binding response OmpR family regulator
MTALPTRCPCCGADVATTVPLVEGKRVSFGGQAISLPPAQAQLVELLIRRRPGWLSLSEAVWGLWEGQDEPGSATIQIHVYLTGLRKALPAIGWTIVNDHGIGWRLERLP